MDALKKLGGTPCVHLRSATGGCGIYDRRPRICGAYRCLWLAGGLEPGDRPDRLGAVVDLLADSASPRLEIREATPGAFDRSARLQEIAERFRELVPVRISDTADPLDPDARFRLLLPRGAERRIRGDRVVEVAGDGSTREHRMPPPQRALRRIWLAFRRWRLRSYHGA